MPDPDWTVVTDVARLQAGALVEAVVGRSVIVLAWVDGRPWAASGLCPHQFTRLAEGRIAEGRLHCPRHQASFCLRSGAPDERWQIDGLTLYPVRVSGEAVEIDARAVERPPG